MVMPELHLADKIGAYPIFDWGRISDSSESKSDIKETGHGARLDYWC